MGSWFTTNGNRAGAGIGVLAPYALAAARDPEVQLSLGRAATASRDAFDRVSALNPRDALNAVAYDSRVHDLLGQSARELDSAVDAIGFKARKRRSGAKRVLMIVGAITIIAGTVACLRHFFGGGGEEFVPEVEPAPTAPEGADTPAG